MRFGIFIRVRQVVVVVVQEMPTGYPETRTAKIAVVLLLLSVGV